MKTSFALKCVAIGALAAAAVSAPAFAQNFSFVERATSDTVVDVGEKGDSAGDILTFANDIYDETNTNKVGTDSGYCVRIVPGQAWDCSFSVALSDGQIMLSGPFLDGKDSTMSIVGGTGQSHPGPGTQPIETGRRRAGGLHPAVQHPQGV